MKLTLIKWVSNINRFHLQIKLLLLKTNFLFNNMLSKYFDDCCSFTNVFPYPQSGKAAEKAPAKPCDVEVYEKKIKLLEKQRKDVSLICSYCSSSYAMGESLCVFFSYMFSLICFTLWCWLQVLEVNKQWDIQWNSMKSQFEQKVQ